MQSALIVVQGLGMMALIVITFGIIHAMHWPRWVRHVVLGVLFGLGAIFSMLQPVQLSPGVHADTRNLFVGFSGAFIGPIGAVVTYVIAAAFRIYLGGSGAMIGVPSMFIAMAIGILWGLPRLRPSVMTIGHCALMGVTFSVTLLLGLFILKGDAWSNYLFVLPFIALFNVGGSVFFGMLFERERRSARRERRLTEEAEHDPLTAAYNRRGLDKLYTTAMFSQSTFGRGLLLIDLDHFKSINDTLGHAFGDEVLRATTTAIQSCIRGGDVLARIGGEEFVVLLPNVSSDDARKIAERIRVAIRKVAGTDNVTITASVGVSYWQHGGRTLESALHDADTSMYEAKRQGRDRTVFQDASVA